MLNLYNSLTRKLEPFIPQKSNEVSMYSCGPTVYGYAHIGNFRTYIMADILRRTLEVNGYTVKAIMNITDVGHLVGDGDDGEDKMLVAMRREGKTAWDVAKFYESAFLKDVANLNLKPFDKYTRATEHITEQITMVQALETKGYTYRTSDGIYFDTAKLPNYGRLGGQKAEDKKAGARVEMGEKKSPTDFALWKFSPADVKREMEWPSPWGIGFPGWHIECSAMAKKYLGVPFDIHTGGMDLKPVHHENELAQVQGADGVDEARVWMHGEFLTVDGGKMSKSLGNVYTINNIIEHGFDPLAYRLFTFTAHYRTLLNFTWESIDVCAKQLTSIKKQLTSWQVEPAQTVNQEYKSKFLDAVNNDLNLPQSLAVFHQLLKDQSIPLPEKASTIIWMDEVFGLNLKACFGPTNQQEPIPEAVQLLLNDRLQAREEAKKTKDWSQVDAIRDKILALGYMVEDTAKGQVIHKQ